MISMNILSSQITHSVHFAGDLDYPHAVKYVAVGIPVTGYPRTDPGVRDLRTGLLPRVSGGEPLHRPWMKNPNPW
jgi:hypothetical protein